jgi:ParB-like chromosome segregation protein Spo0J
MKKMNDIAKYVVNEIKKLNDDEKISMINKIKIAMHNAGPLKNEPVDCVIWVKNDLVFSNDYNPNAVAPPEMELLHTSISEDGYTQPIVTMAIDGKHEVVDGFHRNRVGKECKDIESRVHGYLPIVCINHGREDKADRMAATIRHNRARGKHKVSSMSEIVLELKKRNWSDDKISKQLGMDSDEVLRLAQITGLAEMFKDQDFSQAWEAEVFDEEQIDQPL